MLRWDNQVCLFQYDASIFKILTFIYLSSKCVKVNKFKIVAAASFQSTNRVIEFADSKKRSTNSITRVGTKYACMLRAFSASLFSLLLPFLAPCQKGTRSQFRSEILKGARSRLRKLKMVRGLLALLVSFPG